MIWYIHLYRIENQEEFLCIGSATKAKETNHNN
jgi:hypothetical protein